MAWRVLIDTQRSGSAGTRARARRPASRLRARSSPHCSPRAPSASGGLRGGPPTVETIDALADAAGIAARMVGRRRQAHDRLAGNEDRAARQRSGSTAASEAQARDSLTRLHRRDARRRLPFSLVLRLDEPLAAPLRDAPADGRRADRAARTARVARMAHRGRRRRAARPARRTRASPSARSRCRPCRSAAIGSLSTASTAR